MPRAAKVEPPRVSLLAHPGTPQQRVTHIVHADRDDRREWALNLAVKQYGTDVPKAWLDHATQVVTPITADEMKEISA